MGSFNKKKNTGRPGGPKGPSQQKNRPSQIQMSKGAEGKKNTQSLAYLPGRWVIGEHACMEVLKVRPFKVSMAWLQEDWDRHQDLLQFQDLFQKNKIPFQLKSSRQLEELGSGHRGIALLVTETPVLHWQALKSAESAVVLVLDGIEDVHNLGSMMRTAWLLGVAAIFIPQDRATKVTPTVAKIASGGAEHISVEVVSSIPDLLHSLKDAGFWVYALDESGQSNLYNLDLAKKVAWVIGAEDKGLRKPTLNASDFVVQIPQASTGSSYNASIAASLCLGESQRQLKLIG